MSHRFRASKRKPISEIKEEDDSEEVEAEDERRERRDFVKRRRLTFADRLDKIEWQMTKELLRRDKERKQDYIT